MGRVLVGIGLALAIAGAGFALGAFDRWRCPQRFSNVAIDYGVPQGSYQFGVPADVAILGFLRNDGLSPGHGDLTNEEVLEQIPELTPGKSASVTVDLDGSPIEIHLEWGGTGWRVSGYSQVYPPDC